MYTLCPVLYKIYRTSVDLTYYICVVPLPHIEVVVHSRKTCVAIVVDVSLYRLGACLLTTHAHKLMLCV